MFPVLFTVAAAADKPVTAETVRIAVNPQGESIQVKPLDAPDNPYSGQYEPWDMWVWDNYQAGFSAGEYRAERNGDVWTYTSVDGEAMPTGWVYEQLQVDKNGFAIPAVVGYMIRSGARGTGHNSLQDAICNRPSGPSYNETYFIYGAGVRPTELAEAIKHAYSLSSATGFPIVPAWLGEHLPPKVVFAPNGDIICYGELDLRYQDTGVDQYRLEYMVCNETWYRYSAKGELLGDYTPGADYHGVSANTDWINLYCPDIDNRVSTARTELTEAGTPPDTTYHYYGHIALVVIPGSNNSHYMGTTDLTNAEIPIAWDYLGNEIDPQAPFGHDPLKLGNAIRRDRLSEIYAAQVELGLTDPAEESPFAGKANGPQSVDPVPRMPRYKATGRRSSFDAIEVRPLDDPDNPYAGDYRSWDTWMFEQIGQRNPKEDEYQQAQHRKNQELIEAKIKAGEEVSPMDHSYTPYKPGPEDPWVNHSIMVTDEGWVIPAHIYAELEALAYSEPQDVLSNRNEPHPANYSLRSGGVMPAEMLEEYLAAIRPYAGAGRPILPDWLIAQPVHYVIFAPNGDVITLGPKGFRTPENANARGDELWTDIPRAWYRYDANGELLDTLESKGWDWQPLYYPQWNALKSNASDTGMEASVRSGYLVIKDPVTDTIKAVFDYDGTPVNPNAPILRRYHYCRMLHWSTIDELIPIPDKGDAVSLHEVAKD